MSRTILRCRCQTRLAVRHHTGRLFPLAGVMVYFEPNGRGGPYLALCCPKCGKAREYAIMEETPGEAAGRTATLGVGLPEAP